MSKKNNNEWVPEYKYESLTDSFVDYRGNTRKFTLVAVSVPLGNSAKVSYKCEDIISYPSRTYVEDDGTLVYVPARDEEVIKDKVISTVPKALCIGIAVPHMSEDPNYVSDKLGVRIAYGKAISALDRKASNDKFIIYASQSGLINHVTVQAILASQAEFVKNNPALYIKAFDKDREQYEASGKIATAELTIEEHGLMNEMNGMLNDMPIDLTDFDNDIPAKECCDIPEGSLCCSKEECESGCNPAENQVNTRLEPKDNDEDAEPTSEDEFIRQTNEKLTELLKKKINRNN